LLQIHFRLEIGCDNGERVRVAFALGCCDRVAMSFFATTGGISGDDVRDLKVAAVEPSSRRAVEHRFGRVNRSPVTIEWLSDNGSRYIAGDARSFARDIGLEPRTTPIESPQSNEAEAFVRTTKRDYIRVCPRPKCRVRDASAAVLPSLIAHYNEVHQALGYRSPREFIVAHERP
jgi:putative transposase